MTAASFPPLVYTLWWIGIGVTLLVFVPLAVVLLHRLWQQARGIQWYAHEALIAAAGIVEATSHVAALDDTIAVAGGILEAAGSVDAKLAIVADVLAQRAGE